MYAIWFNKTENVLYVDLDYALFEIQNFEKKYGKIKIEDTKTGELLYETR